MAAPDLETVSCVVALVRAGALSGEELSLWIDREVAASEAPPGWLIDASLAATADDKLSRLRDGPSVIAEAEPILLLEAALAACERGRRSPQDLARLALHIVWDHELPTAVSEAVYALDEDALCAHDFDGIPQSARVQASIANLRAQLAVHSRWRGRVVALCSTVG